VNAEILDRHTLERFSFYSEAIVRAFRKLCSRVFFPFRLNSEILVLLAGIVLDGRSAESSIRVQN
jgi:hypothetical protein